MTRIRRSTAGRHARDLRRARIHSTLGDLIAAAYDALGPDAGPGDVARLLSAPAMLRHIGARGRGVR